jgi:(p)ppGpp synthase/HD superfamily hydrolase
MSELEQALTDITMAPYIVKAMALISVRRKGGSNMFRHQISTMGILLDYKIVDSVLLKAAVIHDLFEDAPDMPGVSREAITDIDSDGAAVYDLVMEVTMRSFDGKRESKAEYLTRLMLHGSPRAKVLKLADRISNMTALGFVHDPRFVRRFLAETKQFVMPYAAAINQDMHLELSHLIENREALLAALRTSHEPGAHA